MTETGALSDRVERLSRAVHPGLLDAAIDPNLLIVLILANMMSDRLWHIRDQILTRAGDAHSVQITEQMLQFIDHHFTHDFPMGTAERVGVMDLQDERDRLGAAAVTQIKHQLWRHVTRRRADGLLTPALDIFPVLERDQLPVYTYSTIDGLHAMSRVLGHKKHRPMGVTVCADEATLTTALACILHGISVADAFIIGSPGHYSTFLQKDGQCFWCNGKPEFFDQARWHALTTGSEAADPIAEFDRRVPYADRFITLFGSLILGGISSIPAEELQRFEVECTAFFGAQLPPFYTLHQEKTVFGASQANRQQLLRLDNLENAAAIRKEISQLVNEVTVFDQAFYCYRDIHVATPAAYLANAIRGPKLRKRAETIDGVGSALHAAAQISGTTSIFGCRDRVAVADEVLLFDTGDDVDRGLLLLALLLASPCVDPNTKSVLRLTVTDKSSFLSTSDTVLDIGMGDTVEAVCGRVWMELSQSALRDG